MTGKYHNLFSPIKVGSLTFKNRIVSGPVSVADLDWKGHLTRDNLWHYKRKAMGGAAVVTLGESIVHSATGKSHALQILLDDPGVIPSLTKTADAIKESGALASIELSHGGLLCTAESLGGRNPVGPSSVTIEKNFKGMETSPIFIEEMSEALIDEVADSYGVAAEIVKRAGFDMCMIHAGHGWLLAQFMSPLTNKRKDKYGGSIENRMRFPLMAIDRVREAVGFNFPIEIRISGAEFTEGGLTIDDTVAIAKMIEDKVDLIHVSAGTFGNPGVIRRIFPTVFQEHGCNVYLAGKIKKAVKIPVVTVGGISDPAQMEQIIADGRADIIAMGRGLLADPDMPEKAKSCREDEIVPCIRCLDCLGSMYATMTMKCTVNPIIGREFENSCIQPSLGQKKVLIVGGGPAGMQAAITAAERGHKVTLYEEMSSLGGLLKFAGHVSFKEDLAKFCEYLVCRVNSLAIKVRLNTKVTPALVASEHPDVLIAAVGSEPITPQIPGIDKKCVIKAIDVHDEGIEIGNKVVVVGGGLVGCETALHLAQQGKDITVIEMMDDVAADANPIHKNALMIELSELVKLQKSTKCAEITDDGVIGLAYDGDKKLFEADTVIVAVGMKSRSRMVEELRDLAPEFAVAGDCVKPKKVMQAIRSGYDAAMNIT